MKSSNLWGKICHRLRLAQFAVAQPRTAQVIRRVLREGWTYLDEAALYALAQQVVGLEGAQQPGILIEAGCALGGSALVIAQAKAQRRPFYIYDAFGLIPPPSAHDQADAHQRYAEIAAGHSPGINGQRYYGYETNLQAKVRANFATCGLAPAAHAIHFVPGLYAETLWVDQPIAFAHIDCDWYDSVLTCLQRITPQLVAGGVMIIDDYHDWSGCKRAVDSYFADLGTQFTFTMHARLHIRKKH